MIREYINKTILIVAIIAFAVILILPTVGKKKMEIHLLPDVSQEQITVIEKRFPSNHFSVEKTQQKITVGGYRISDAVMNEVKVYGGVKDVAILPHWAEKYLLAKKVNLGLDLQGGMHLVLMADFNKIQRKLIVEKKILTEKKAEIEKSKDPAKVKDELESLNGELDDLTKNKLNDDNQLRESYKSEITSQALELLRNRVDKFGVAEPSIRPRGNEAIEIQLPGVKDPVSVKKAIGTTGSVEYRLADDAFTAKAHEWLMKNYSQNKLPDDSEELYDLSVQIAKEINLPNTLEILFLFVRNEKTKQILPTDVMALRSEVALDGSDISKAWVGHDEYGGFTVQFKTTTEGASKFAKATAIENKGKKLAIIIDDKIRSAPRINDPILGGSASITGDFTMEEVKALARIIQEGALPVGLRFVEERTVGPSLGQESMSSSLNAAILAFSVIMIFVLLYYKLSGIIAVMGIILNSVFMLALLSWLGFTLTLPGIAGFILTFGMSVDSNVIIYERIKEEQRAGKSLRVAISNGFDRAFWTIVDSNLTTLIAAFVLAQYGTGPIKGFAVSLFIGVTASLFVALFITKFVFTLVSSTKIKKLSI